MLTEKQIIDLKRQVLVEKAEAKKAMDFFPKDETQTLLYAVALAKLNVINKILKNAKQRSGKTPKRA